MVPYAAGALSNIFRSVNIEEFEFEHLLLAHGGPVIGAGRKLLQELVEAGGRTAFEM